MLALHGGTMMGRSLQVSRANVRMTGSEIFKWVKGRLALQEEVQTLREASGSQESRITLPQTTDGHIIRGVQREELAKERAATPREDSQTKAPTRIPEETARENHGRSMVCTPKGGDDRHTPPSQGKGDRDWNRGQRWEGSKGGGKGGRGSQNGWYDDQGGKGKGWNRQGWQGQPEWRQHPQGWQGAQPQGKGVGGKGVPAWSVGQGVKGSGKGVGTENPNVPPPGSANRTMCRRCEREGRPSDHDWRTCTAQSQGPNVPPVVVRREGSA